MRINWSNQLTEELCDDHQSLDEAALGDPSDVVLYDFVAVLTIKSLLLNLNPKIEKKEQIHNEINDLKCHNDNIEDKNR